MKRLTGLSILFCLLFFSGCAYKVNPTSMAALQIYSSYDEKIPGTWILLIDDSAKNVTREISTSSYVCSAHKYPINIGNRLAYSIKQTMDSVFQNIIERSSMPTAQELKQTNAQGTILIKLDTFEPRVSCSMGFWSGSCTATTDVKFAVIVRGYNGKLFATSAGETATADGDSGSSCQGVAYVLSQSISKSTREALERVGERLANSSKLRKNNVM